MTNTCLTYVNDQNENVFFYSEWKVNRILSIFKIEVWTSDINIFRQLSPV